VVTGAIRHRRYPGQCASPSIHGADPKDRWHHGPPPCRQPRRPLPLPCLHRRRHFLQAKQAPRTPGCCQISRVRVATGCSIGLPTLPPHPAKTECPRRGTRRSGLAGEQPRKRGSGAEEQERVIRFDARGGHQEEELKIWQRRSLRHR
jgi:hypothetical protein